MTLRIRGQGSPQPAGVKSGKAEDEDGWAARLAKLIPAEALGLYGAASAMAPVVKDGVDPGPRQNVLWALVIVCLIFSAALRWRATAADGKPQILAIVIALVSFILWLLAMGSPTSPFFLPNSYGFAAPIAALVWGTIVPIFYKGD